jgi:hypothetical protein
MDDAAGDDNNNDLNDGTGIGEGKGNYKIFQWCVRKLKFLIL